MSMGEIYNEYLEQKGQATREVVEARNAYEDALERYLEAVQEWEFRNTADFLQKHDNLNPHSEPVIDDRHRLDMDLDEIYFKYERLTSMIGILQMFTAEIVEIAGAPANSLNDALFEIEIGMGEANDRLKSLFLKRMPCGTNAGCKTEIYGIIDKISNEEYLELIRRFAGKFLDGGDA